MLSNSYIRNSLHLFIIYFVSIHIHKIGNQQSIGFMIANPSLQLKQVDKNNRGLFSKSQFKPWSTVLQCQPICTSLSISHRNRFCSYCLIEKQVSRCSQCKIPYYCSKQCQKQDWKAHKLECGYLKKFTQTKADSSKITMEILLNIRLWFLCEKDQQIRNKISEMCCLVDFQTPQKLKQFQQTAVALTSILQIQRNEQNISDLVKRQSTVSLNCFTIQDYICTQQAIGLGVYWPANFINHHCHSNCSQIFDGRVLKIVANRPISEGEQITISYMPMLQSWQNKKKLCREGYLFECFCEECQVNRMFDETLMYLKCPLCQNSSIRNKKKGQTQKEDSDEQVEEGKRNKQEYYCQGCKKDIESAQINKIIQAANKQLSTISSKQSSYQLLKKSLITLRKLISEKDPRMKECIYQVYNQSLIEAQKDNRIYSQSYILLKQMVEMVPKWYRLSEEDQIPYVYAWRYAQLGKIAYYLQKFKKACEYTEKAYGIIEKIKFKHQFPEVKELRQRYEQMKIGLSFNKAQIFKKN